MSQTHSIFGFIFLGVIFIFTMREIFRSASFRKQFQDDLKKWNSPDSLFELGVLKDWEINQIETTSPNNRDGSEFLITGSGIDPLRVYSMKLTAEEHASLNREDGALDEDAFEKLTAKLFKEVNKTDVNELKNSEILYCDEPLFTYFEGALNGEWLRQWAFVHGASAVIMEHRLNTGLLGIAERNEAADLVTENFRWIKGK